MYVIADAMEGPASTEPKTIQNASGKTNMIAPCRLIEFRQGGQDHELKGIVIQGLNGKAEVIKPNKLATTKTIYPMSKREEGR